MNDPVYSIHRSAPAGGNPTAEQAALLRERYDGQVKTFRELGEETDVHWTIWRRWALELGLKNPKSCARGIEHHTFIRYPADARYSYCTRCGKPMRTAVVDVPPPLYAQGTLLRLRKQFRHLYETAMPRGPLTVIAVYRAQGMHTYTLARPTDPIGPSWRAYEEHLEECGGKR